MTTPEPVASWPPAWVKWAQPTRMTGVAITMPSMEDSIREFVLRCAKPFDPALFLREYW